VCACAAGRGCEEEETHNEGRIEGGGDREDVAGGEREPLSYQQAHEVRLGTSDKGETGQNQDAPKCIRQGELGREEHHHWERHQ